MPGPEQALREGTPRKPKNAWRLACAAGAALLVALAALPAQADEQKTLERVESYAKKLKELVDKYRKAEIPIIKHEVVRIHDQRGNPKDCSLRIWYNNGHKVELRTSGGKFEGNFDHGKKPLSAAISLRISECACRPIPGRTRHTQTWPALSEPIEKIKQVLAEEVEGYAEDQAKELAKKAVEKIAGKLGVAAEASGFLTGFAAGAELGASVGNYLTEQINQILDRVAGADLTTAGRAARGEGPQMGDSPDPAHPNAGLIRARGLWGNLTGASPKVKDSWDITVRCGGRTIDPAHAAWTFVSELTPKRAVTTAGGDRTSAEERAEAARKRDAARRERERKARLKREREKREAEERRRRAEEKRRYQEKMRKLRAKAAEIARTCSICDPIRKRIAAVEKEIGEREAALPGLQRAVADAQDALERARRAERAARDRLSRFRNPRSSITDHTTGRTVTSTDLEVRRQASREIWGRYASGELSAEETTAEWAKLDDPAYHEALKKRAEKGLEARVEAASKAREAAEGVLAERRRALARARRELRDRRADLDDLRARLAECIKQCKANAMGIARGWYQSYEELPGVESLAAPRRPAVQVKVLSVTPVSGNNPFDARDPTAEDSASATAGSTGGGAGSNPLAESASPPSYSGNAGCGINSTNLEVVSSTVIALNPLGANGRTLFNVDAAGNATSQSSNLIIFGVAGHSCGVSGASASGFTLSCSRSGASCTEGFSR